MLQSVLCNANHSFDFTAILGEKKFLINETFYPCEQKLKRWHLNPVCCRGRQRKEHSINVFDV